MHFTDSAPAAYVLVRPVSLFHRPPLLLRDRAPRGLTQVGHEDLSNSSEVSSAWHDPFQPRIALPQAKTGGLMAKSKNAPLSSRGTYIEDEFQSATIDELSAAAQLA